jgi:hypothetical protein
MGHHQDDGEYDGECSLIDDEHDTRGRHHNTGGSGPRAGRR